MEWLTEKLQAAIKKRGLTQKAAARELVISEPYLSDVLSARRKVSIAVALKIENVFGIKAESILVRQVREELEDARLAELASVRDRVVVRRVGHDEAWGTKKKGGKDANSKS